jgi:hypothetical protein
MIDHSITSRNFVRKKSSKKLTLRNKIRVLLANGLRDTTQRVVKIDLTYKIQELYGYHIKFVIEKQLYIFRILYMSCYGFFINFYNMKIISC